MGKSDASPHKGKFLGRAKVPKFLHYSREGRSVSGYNAIFFTNYPLDSGITV